MEKIPEGGALWFVPFTNVVEVINSIRLRWPGYVARMEEGRCGFKILICSIKETFRKT